MALVGVAPWLYPPDFMGAIARGASVGLERSRLDEQAHEAADRLSLGFAELASQNARANAAAALHHANEQTGLDQWTQEFAERQRHARAEEALRGQELGLRLGKLGGPGKSTFRNVGGTLLEITPEGQVKTAFKPETIKDPLMRLRYSDAERRRAAALKVLMNPKIQPGTPVHAQAEKELDAAQSILQQIESGQVPAAPAAPSAVPEGLNSPLFSPPTEQVTPFSAPASGIDLFNPPAAAAPAAPPGQLRYSIVPE